MSEADSSQYVLNMIQKTDFCSGYCSFLYIFLAYCRLLSSKLFQQ